MQTFLPYSDFSSSAKCLDRQRLGKQRVEVLQLLKALAGETNGWSNHPAAAMWRGYEHSLISYGLHICNEWLSRGYKDTCWNKINSYRDKFPDRTSHRIPPWLGDSAFHDSHKSNLLRKAPILYYKYGWDVPRNLEYVWPKGDNHADDRV